MIIKNNKIITKKQLVISVLIFLALVIVASAFWFFNRKDVNKELTDQVDRTSAIKKEQIINSTNADDSSSNLPSKTPDNSKESISESKSNVETPTTAPEKPYLSRAEQIKSGEIKIVATLQHATPGYCELQLRKTGAQTISAEAYIVVGPSYYICSFTIPRIEISPDGQWDVVVLHHIGSKQTGSDPKTIGVK